MERGHCDGDRRPRGRSQTGSESRELTRREGAAWRRIGRAAPAWSFVEKVGRVGHAHAHADNGPVEPPSR